MWDHPSFQIEKLAVNRSTFELMRSTPKPTAQLQDDWTRPLILAASGPGLASCGGGRSGRRLVLPHCSCTQGDKQTMHAAAGQLQLPSPKDIGFVFTNMPPHKRNGLKYLVPNVIVKPSTCHIQAFRI